MTTEQRLLVFLEGIKDELHGINQTLQRRQETDEKIIKVVAEKVVEYVYEVTGGDDDTDQN